jgi:succinyl-CoA synthetase beta subunit
MARLHEYQGKQLLAKAGIDIPRGGPACSPVQAAEIAGRLLDAEAKGVVIKIQAWTTGRAGIGGVAFADTPDQARMHAARMLAMKVGNFPVSQVLVEERLKIAREFFVSLTVDDRERAPVLLLAVGGGTGIEDRAKDVHRLPCDVHKGIDAASLDKVLSNAALDRHATTRLREAINAIFTVAKTNEARSVEVNPLVLTHEDKVVAADCRVTIDDYAVFRHPDLGIEIARELDHPPTPLERIAYQVEQEDHRGTFYFAQMNVAGSPSAPGSPSAHAEGVAESSRPGVARAPAHRTPIAMEDRLIAFHGAGGGGSMMSMDAITAEGFTIANFCDTSGNPSPAKVYRAARIILSQPDLIGYFGSGSGVANQEQYWSAYGLAKAFWELNLDIPAVIRLGGNTEDRAVDILQDACKDLPARVEGYKKADSPAKIAKRFSELLAQSKSGWKPRPPRRPAFVGSASAASFAIKGGRVWIDPAAWPKNAPAIISRSAGLLRDDGGRPALAVRPEELMMKDGELIACEVECRRAGIDDLFVELDIPGLQ